MQVAQFESAPTKERHPSYSASFLYCTAPEWSTGEVLLSAACRGLVLGVSESAVGLDNIVATPDRMPGAVGGRRIWGPLLLERGGIASPLRHGQYSPTASRQLMPLVPTTARIAGVLGKRPRSRWNPTNLLLDTIGAGVGKTAGESLTRALGNSLDITSEDDVFARFVESSLRLGLQGVDPEPAAVAPYHAFSLDEAHLRAFEPSALGRPLSPAQRFCADLPTLLALKSTLTRRQWTVLLESLFRVGLGMHVLWTCNANIIAWENALSVASGQTPPTPEEIHASFWETHNETRPLLQLGTDAEPLIERMIERYANARTGLNLLLCRLDDANVPWPASHPIGFCTQPPQGVPSALAAFYSHVHTNRLAIDANHPDGSLRERVACLFDDDADVGRSLRELANHKSGYTKNVFEFARHALGQIKAKDPDQRCYDLAYLLAYFGDRKPLPVQPGPAMLVTLVHACCAANSTIPVSLDDFRRHLGDYGIHVPAGELVNGKTGRDLAMLGLVVDSPDAAGGRLLVKPF